MKIFASLNRQQKEAIGLLQVGTFLEYFDLMLYVHMAVLLNELFFPKTDPHTAALLTAVAFCSTYALRPLGALLFGWIGDNIGRKTTVIITTMMMALSCVLMANLPTYAQIGITASWIMTGCRIFQGLSSMGERMGAEIYITELIKPPSQYFAVSLCSVSACFGCSLALGVATLVTSTNFNWRIAFWVGAGIAVVGSVARVRLREAPDFADAKRRMKNTLEDSAHDGLAKAADLLKSTNPLWNEKICKKTAISSLLINLAWPLFFFFIYVYCAGILKNQFGFTSAQIIRNNFQVGLFQFFGQFLWAYLSSRIHPILILKKKWLAIFLLAFFTPSFLGSNDSPANLLIFQCLFIFLTPDSMPAESILIKHFPIFKRFTCVTFIYAVSRAIMYIITAFGMIYLTDWFGYWGLSLIFISTLIGYLYGVLHFEKLETQHSNGVPLSAKFNRSKQIR